jgi:methionyl aminopeptidase
LGSPADEEMEAYIKAGQTIANVKREVPRIVKEGGSALNICNTVEELTRRDGCKPAFPCNVDINEVAAHFTSPPGDSSLIPQDSIVKIDLGAQFSGYIADTAITINFNDELQAMSLAVQEALDRALKVIQVGTKLSEIGSLIERTIKERGFKPISNLTGHGLARYQIHASPTIPNVSTPLFFGRFEAGHAYAIEPFATTRDGAGEIVDSVEGYIYRLTKIKPPKDKTAEKLYESIRRESLTLPFAERWYTNVLSAAEFTPAFNSLLSTRHVEAYPVLIERRRRPVAQAEHSVYVRPGETLILT